MLYSESVSWTVEVLDRRVEKELAALPLDMRADFLDIVNFIEQHGIAAAGERVKSLGRGLYEMRMTGRDGIARGIYVKAKPERLVVVLVFIKKTQKTPAHMLDVALKRAKEVQ
jgi:phage-related protein